MGRIETKNNLDLNLSVAKYDNLCTKMKFDMTNEWALFANLCNFSLKRFEGAASNKETR